MQILYKVLKNGRSTYFIDFEWSLPSEEGPGQFHEYEGELKKCQSGFHLTRNPAHWFRQDFQVFLAEYQGEIIGLEKPIDLSLDKVVARKVRLIRQLTSKELEEFNIFYDGVHEVISEIAFACGTSTINAYDKSVIHACHNATVNAYDNCSVEAWNSSVVNDYYSKYSLTVIRSFDKSSIFHYQMNPND